MLQDLHVRPHEKVLEVGAGSGYMAALLARRAQRVITWNCIPNWQAWPREPAARRHRNAEVREADGAGACRPKPFDVIVLSGSVAEVPPALLAQLKVGGRLAPSSARADDARHFHHAHGEPPSPRLSPGTRWRRGWPFSRAVTLPVLDSSP
jgi:protein-L-isoaspartate O-methyltransferase